jgi:transposase
VGEIIFAKRFFSSRHSESCALDLVIEPGGGQSVWLGIAQRGIADARELVGEGAGCLVMIGAALQQVTCKTSDWVFMLMV